MNLPVNTTVNYGKKSAAQKNVWRSKRKRMSDWLIWLAIFVFGFYCGFLAAAIFSLSNTKEDEIHS